MKEDIKSQVKRLARHLGFPFSNEEEREGVVENIIKLCSFKNLKNLEGNQSGKTWIIDNKHFFRNGEVGDWMNHLTPQMAEQVDQITETLPICPPEAPVHEKRLWFRNLGLGKLQPHEKHNDHSVMDQER
ncbi:hypothetical protein Sjap_003133 [Stephania japonica]|uniref:Sulfotransferase n=1 Tax=Stephania japonica TaxID=461633 RepID=A0AAP0KN62_9MAGN